jgi:hypothetical protein
MNSTQLKSCTLRCQGVGNREILENLTNLSDKIKIVIATSALQSGDGNRCELFDLDHPYQLSLMTFFYKEPDEFEGMGKLQLALFYVIYII